MHHTCVYDKTFTAANTETELAAVTDNYLVIQNSHFLPQRDVNLLYAAAMGATILRSRINTPTLGVITSPFIMPVSPLLSMSSPMKFRDFTNYPVKLSKLEEIQVFTVHSAAGAEENTAILGLDMGQQPVPPGTIYTIRGTATATLVAAAWTNLGTITWQNTLTSGLYAVVGAVFQSATGIAGRIIFENTPYRPGGPAQLLITDWTADLFRVGGLGVWGQFHNYAMPTVEMLASAGDTTESVFLDLVKIG